MNDIVRITRVKLWVTQSSLTKRTVIKRVANVPNEPREWYPDGYGANLFRAADYYHIRTCKVRRDYATAYYVIPKYCYA
jgi:hypothetical protein